MRFRFEHKADLDAAVFLGKLCDLGFLGAVHRVDGPEAEKAVLVDVMDDARNDDTYRIVREVAKAENLVPHATKPEEDIIRCWRRKL